MTATTMVTVDANEAVASVAYRLSEVVAIYPITPASPMGEHCDEWSTRARSNAWGQVPVVTEMQSEGGAAGTVHGALQAGALTTTLTASQGLLLMIPNMYKIAGELNAFCMHVAARTVATHALSIFGDHSDVYACRGTGFALLCSGSVQEAQDLAAIAHAATLRSRVPFLHFFDGFRTSHELGKIHPLDDSDLLAMIDETDVTAHRDRALSPDRPVLRGTAHNPDTFFRAREASNPFYDDCPRLVEAAMARFADRTGRAYGLFDFVGHPRAERVVVMMGSGAETAHETVERLVARGDRVGVLKVRLLRPFSVRAFLDVLPGTVEAIAVLDRTKEPGAPGEPLYQDVVTALAEAGRTGVTVIGGRYGLSSREFTPTMVGSILGELDAETPRRRFTVGITDDVSGLSLPRDRTRLSDPREWSMESSMRRFSRPTRRQALRLFALGGAAALTWRLAASRAPRSQPVRRSRPMMGTYVELTIFGEDREACAAAADATLERMAALERSLSRHSPDSELSALVRDGRLSEASEGLLNVLRLARRVSDWGHGAFDITVQPVLDLYASQPRGSLPPADAIEQALTRVDNHAIQVDGTTVTLARPDMRITLDGIGKGYIVDQGVATLRSRGFANVFLDAGGDLVAGGENTTGRPWRIGIRHPRGPALQARFDARDRAVATSGDYMQPYSTDYTAHHIVDPRTGRSTPELASSTVLAPSAALADALATLTMALGPAQGRDLLEALPDCEGYFVSKDLAVTRTSGFNVV